MSLFAHPDFDRHQDVIFRHDEKTGLKAIIAIHNTTLGPALGGCRMFPYQSEAAALSDVLRLSRAMTYKSALAGLSFGGGKAVIIGDPLKYKNRDLLLAMGELVEELGGRYITAEDAGTSVADIAVMAECTRHICGLVPGGENDGDPSPATAQGVFDGIQAAVRFRYGTDLQGVRVAVQGVGKVGGHLAAQLAAAGARVFIADTNPHTLKQVAVETGAKVLSLDEIVMADVNVLAPCAMGGAINRGNIDSIKAGIIAGSANNQLADPEIGRALWQRDILYAPDYVINAGGIIAVSLQMQGRADTAIIDRQVAKISATLERIFTRSRQLGKPTSDIANTMAEAVLAGGCNTGGRDSSQAA